MTAYAVQENPTSFTGLGVWRYRTETVAPPAVGQIRFDNADVSLATEFYLNETNDDGSDVSTFIDLLMTEGSTLYIQDRTDADKFVLLELGTSVDNGTYRTFQIANLIEGSGGEPSQNTQVALIVTTGALVNGVIAIGTPVNDQLAIWTGPNSVEGDDNLQWTKTNSGRLEIKCVDNVVNNQGIFMIDTDSVLNPDGWQWVVGQGGLHDGTLILTHKPADVINNRDVTYLPGNRPTFGFGIAVASDKSIGDESAGTLAYFQPRDTTGREETKISFVGFVGGTGHEGVFSIEGYNYGDSGLQFNRLAHFVVDPDYKLHTDFFGTVNLGTLGVDAPVVAGDNCTIGYSQVNGMELTGQGTTNDLVIFNDLHREILSIPSSAGQVRIHYRFAASRYMQMEQNNTNFQMVGVNNINDFTITGLGGEFNVDNNIHTQGKFLADGDTAAGDLAAMGYTAVEGLILTGQGSTNDVTIKNDADAEVMGVPTGTTTADFKGSVKVAGYTQFPTITDAQLNDITHVVNTGADKIQGAMVYNSTQDVPVWATGAADGSVWVDGAGTTVNTPV